MCSGDGLVEAEMLKCSHKKPDCDKQGVLMLGEGGLSGFGHVSGFGDRGWLTSCSQGHLTQCESRAPTQTYNVNVPCGGPALICPSWLFSLLWCP